MERHFGNIAYGCLGLPNLLQTFELLLVVALKQQVLSNYVSCTMVKSWLKDHFNNLIKDLSSGSGSKCKSRLQMKMAVLKLVNELHYNEMVVQPIIQFPLSSNLTLISLLWVWRLQEECACRLEWDNLPCPICCGQFTTPNSPWDNSTILFNHLK